MRATASIAPVMMPESAVGMTTLRIVRHFGMPRAYDASRRSRGTMRSISSVDRTTTGSMRMVNAIEAAKPERSMPRVSTNAV